MTTEIDAEGLDAARAAVRRALMSGEVGTMGAADVAITAYLATPRTSEAEPVAWQWQQCKSAKPGEWPETWNNIELRLGEDRTEYWRNLASRIPDEVRVRPLYTHPTPASDDQVEAALLARKRLQAYADDANAGRAQAGGRELARKIWAAFAEFDALAAMGSTKP